MDYLLKSALISVTLFAFYKAFLERETFFQSNRIFFIVGIFTSLLLPLVLIPIEVVVQAPINTTIKEVIPLVKEIKNIPFVETIYNVRSFDWTSLIFSIYWFGVGIFTLKFVSEILTLFYLIYKNPKKRERDYIQVDTKSKTAPFSFFVWIVFNKNQYTKSELKHIISHEKVHVKQWHSADMMFIQLLTIIQWFNPFVWFFKKELQQNLEYIADKNVHLAFEGTTEKESNLKDYQYLLVKTGIGKDPFATTNNFFNSHLKKRIIMLQKSKTNRFNQINSFSTKEVIVVEKSSKIANENISTQQVEPHFIVPILNKDLTRMSSGYGMRMHPVLKIRKMHNGMDLSAKKGTSIYASEAGTILLTGSDSKYGKMIKINHRANFQTNYYHLGEILVDKGDFVEAGDLIAKVGSTGESTAPHLHFEVLKDGEPINPMSVLSLVTATKVKKLVKKVTTNKIEEKQYNKNKTYQKVIYKNSSQKDLDKIREYYKKLGLNLIFNNVNRNDKGEIISIAIKAKSENSKANFNAKSSRPITSIYIDFDDTNDSISISIKKDVSHSKKSYSISKNTSEAQSKTITINNYETEGSDNSKGKSYSYTINTKEDNGDVNTETIYVVENTGKTQNTKDISIIRKNSDDQINWTGSDKDSLTISIDEKQGKTTYIVNGKEYTEEELRNLENLNIKLGEINKNEEEYEKSPKDRLKKAKQKLKEQEKKLKKQEERLERQEKSLRKREDALRKRKEVQKRNFKGNKIGNIQYKGKSYYYNGDDFFDRFGTKVSKKLTRKLNKLKA